MEDDALICPVVQVREQSNDVKEIEIVTIYRRVIEMPKKYVHRMYAE